MQELNEYGIDFDGPVPELESEQQENLNILDIPNPLSGDDFAELQQRIDVYISTCSFVRARLGT